MTDRVQWGPNRAQAFVDWAGHEVERSLSARGSLEKLWRSYLTLYRAPTSTDIAHFPFEGASDVTVPVVRMTVDPILARYMANIHAPINLWSLAALNERWVDTAKPLQDYLTWIDKHLLKMWDVNYRVFQEMLKLGTGIYKSAWRYEQRRKTGYDATKRRARLIETINQPFVDHVHLFNFLIPPEALAIEPDRQGGAAWVAERHRLRPNQLRAMAKGQEPFLPNFTPEAVAKVLTYEETTVTPHHEHIIRLEERTASTSLQYDRPIEFWELHARFDSTGDGFDDDLVVVYHHATRTILRATYEPMNARPYTAVRYLRGDGFYGIGLGEQAQVWQEITSRVLNFEVDKILLSNAPMLAVKEGANIVPNEPVFPGKQWHLANPKDDLVPFFMSAPGAFDISSLRAYLTDQTRQSTGVTDLVMGSVSGLPSRTPATTVQSLLQEGNTRFDLSIKDLRESGLSEVGLRVLQNLQQQATDSLNNPEAAQYVQLAPYLLGNPEGQAVAQALSIPTESIELGIGVALTATSGLNNKELQKQSLLALIQVTSQMGQGFIQLAQLVTQGGAVGQVAMDMFRGGQELLTRLLEQFDISNAEEIVPNIQAAMAAQAQMSQGQQISPMMGMQGQGMPQGQGQF